MYQTRSKVPRVPRSRQAVEVEAANRRNTGLQTIITSNRRGTAGLLQQLGPQGVGVSSAALKWVRLIIRFNRKMPKKIKIAKIFSLIRLQGNSIWGNEGKIS